MTESPDEIETILRLTADGSVTIPKRIREALELRTGDHLRVAIEVEERAARDDEEPPSDLEFFSEERLENGEFDPEKVVRLSEAERSVPKDPNR